MSASSYIQLRTVVLAVLCAAVWFSVPGFATAHSYLNSSNPADGAVLSAAPPTITLKFSDGVRKQGLGVTAGGPDGTRSLPATANSRKVTAIWPGDSAPGQYVVTYRAVSVDGHVMSGQISFRIAQSEVSPADEEAGPTASTIPDPTSGSTAAQNSESAVTDQRAPGSVPIWLLAAGAGIALVGVVTFVVLRRRANS